MTASATTPTSARLAVQEEKGRRGSARRRRVQHPWAIVAFVAPFAVMFIAFYLVPIAVAVWQSLLVVEREGTYGAATEVFGGLQQYALVFQNEAFWTSVGRVLVFGVVQVPVMLGLALLFALLLDSPLVRGK